MCGGISNSGGGNSGCGSSGDSGLTAGGFENLFNQIQEMGKDGFTGQEMQQLMQSFMQAVQGIGAGSSAGGGCGPSSCC